MLKFKRIFGHTPSSSREQLIKSTASEQMEKKKRGTQYGATHQGRIKVSNLSVQCEVKAPKPITDQHADLFFFAGFSLYNINMTASSIKKRKNQEILLNSLYLGHT